jgi:hypothetical protein
MLAVGDRPLRAYEAVMVAVGLVAMVVALPRLLLRRR